MAFQPEQNVYEQGIYQLEDNDPVQGGLGGLSNAPLLQLANRTAWLYKTLNDVLSGKVIPTGVAELESPTFTGSPKAPTPTLGDNSNLISTTAFVAGSLYGELSLSVAGGANVTLTPAQAGNGVLYFYGALTANIAIIVPAPGKWTVVNGTTGAYTLTVKTAAGSGVVVTQGRSQNVWADAANVMQQVTDFISPALTGTPTAPTAQAGTNSTQIATTAYVYNAFNGVQSVNVAGNANVALTAAQYGAGIVLLTGALTGSIQVQVPSQSGQWVFANNTTGAYSINIAVAGAGGKTALVPQGQSVVAYSDGTNVVLAGAAASSSFTSYSFTAAAAQTLFNAPYTPGNVLVLVNGAAQDPADITASNGSSITLTGYNGGAGCIGGENVRILAFNSFTVANAMTLAGGTMAGPIMHAGGDTGVTPAQFDNSTKLATTAFVQASIGSFNGFVALSASRSLSASDIGKCMYVSASGLTLTFPTPTSMGLPIGAAFTIFTTSLSATLASGSGTSLTTTNGVVASATIGPGQSITFVALSTTTWQAVSSTQGLGANADFASSLASSGYQKLPTGLIIQWGVSTFSISGSAVTFPLAFPSGVLALTTGNNVSSNVFTTSLSLSLTGFTGYLNTGSSASCYWIALGH